MEEPEPQGGGSAARGWTTSVSKSRLAATLAAVGLLALGVFATAISSSMSQYGDRLHAESLLQSVADAGVLGVAAGAPPGLLQLDVARVDGALRVRSQLAYTERLNRALAETALELPSAGVSHGPSESLAWAVVARPDGGHALFVREVEAGAAEVWLALGMPLLIAGVMVLWVMVWTGYSVGALLERTRQQNRLLTERSEDLAKARDAAEAASAEKATLLANMSHEIRTPMTSVLGLSELLLREDLAPASLEHVEQIRLSACSLVAIINDILDFSKLEAGRVSLKLSPVELRVVVTRTLAGLTVEAREQGLCIPVEVSSEVPAWVELDALRFGQVLLNLVGNAVKFTDEGSVRVSVTAAPRGDGLALQLVVADTGVGISAEDQAQIFEQFSQGAAGSQRDTGTGLGLTITRQLVDLMGGEILLESDVGRGAKFSVELPTRSVDAPAAALESEPEHEVDAALSVLVVEDNEMNRKILAKMLRLLGVAPSVACDGREALEAVRAGNFDLVLMDCRMPVMDGLQATRAIRAAETPGSVGPRIIALTGNASEEDAALCREAGMDGLMAKPVALGQLREVLSETEVADRSGPA